MHAVPVPALCLYTQCLRGEARQVLAPLPASWNSTLQSPSRGYMGVHSPRWAGGYVGVWPQPAPRAEGAMLHRGRGDPEWDRCLVWSFFSQVAAALSRLGMGQVFAPQAKCPNLKHLYNGHPKGVSWGPGNFPRQTPPWLRR